MTRLFAMSGLLFLALFAMTETAPARELTFAEIFTLIATDPAYSPRPCPGKTCVLTGMGGLVSMWTGHVEKNAGKKFIVEGICASACRLAVLHARARGETIVMRPGAKLVFHKVTTWGRK